MRDKGKDNAIVVERLGTQRTYAIIDREHARIVIEMVIPKVRAGDEKQHVTAAEREDISNPNANTGRVSVQLVGRWVIQNELADVVKDKRKMA